MNIPNPHILIISNISLGLIYGALAMFLVSLVKLISKKMLARPTVKKIPPALTDSYELVFKIGEMEIYAPRENKSGRRNDDPVCDLTMNSKKVPAYVHWVEEEENYLLPALQK